MKLLVLLLLAIPALAVSQIVTKGLPPDDTYPSTGGAVRSLVVLDMRDQPAFNERYLAASAQGLLNSRTNTSEKVYLILKDQDEQWIKWLLDTQRIENARYVDTLDHVLDMLPTRDALIYSDSPSHSGNIATTVAGCESLLVATDEEIAKRYRLRITEDLRNRWDSNAEAYRWLLEEYGDEISNHVMSISVPFPTDTHEHPTQPRDYLIANKVLTFWISGSAETDLPGSNRNEEQELLREVLVKEFPANIACLGYPWSGDGYGLGEWDGITFLSQTGKFLVPTDNFANLSVWTCFLPSSKRFASPPEAPPHNPNAIYGSLVMSDGDNLCTWYDFFPGYLQRLPNKLAFPVGWTTGPTLRELAPPIYDYVVEHVPPNHSMGAGVSGIGYVAMEEYGKAYGDDRRDITEEFFRLTAGACDAANLDWMWVMRYGQPGGGWAKRYAKTVGIKAIMGGYGRVTEDVEKAAERHDGVPIFHCVLDASNPESMRREIDRIVALERPPRFLHLFILNWNYGPEELESVASYAQSKGIVLVTPEQLAELYRASRR